METKTVICCKIAKVNHYRRLIVLSDELKVPTPIRRLCLWLIGGGGEWGASRSYIYIFFDVSRFRNQFLCFLLK